MKKAIEVLEKKIKRETELAEFYNEKGDYRDERKSYINVSCLRYAIDVLKDNEEELNKPKQPNNRIEHYIIDIWNSILFRFFKKRV